MSKDISIKNGAKLDLIGLASKEIELAKDITTHAIYPDDFFNLKPRMVVKEGDKVKAGSPIFHDKDDEKIVIVSPVSGYIKSIDRGEKRKILKVLIYKEGDDKINHQIIENKKLTKANIVSLLLESGSWPFIRQRPYNIIARPEKLPKAIFVSTHTTAPYDVDYDFILGERLDDFQKGVSIMSKIIEKPVTLTVTANRQSIFSQIKNLDIINVKGKHPSGNLSFQINRINPINVGECVWVINPEDMANIGSFFKTGNFDSTRTVGVSGETVKNPKYYKAEIGSKISSMISKNDINNFESNRYINGDPLTGTKVDFDGYLGYYNNIFSVIQEGDKYRMFGWLPFKDNHIPSFSRTSFSWLFPKNKKVNTNLNGDERALVITGEMEKFFPMDIYPMQLLKACMIEDIEKMELLGIYEIIPEDFGLIDYSNTSKIEAQEIIKNAIQLMLKEVG
jgi:Na+-transporting NADH:ubiquinone oxidoreductase subunit A